MTLEIAVGIIAVAFAVLVGFLIAALIQVRRAAAETKRLLECLNAELPSVLNEVRLMAGNVNMLAAQARDGFEHASVLLHAVGEVGETVQQVHGLVRGGGGNVFGRLASMVAGVRAATAVVRERLQRERGGKQGGENNGEL